MKALKRLFAWPLLLSLCLLLFASCGVTASGENESTAAPDDLTSLRLQLDYYESRLSELESQLTAAKVQLYLKQSEYEKKLQELENAKAVEEPEPEPQISPDPIWFHEETKDGMMISGVYGAGNRLEVPEKINGIPVIGICDNAFQNGEFSYAVLPDGIKEIGWFAFAECGNLKMISLPSSVESIEYGAFENCPTNLTFLCREGSYAASFARSYGFAVRIVN